MTPTEPMRGYLVDKWAVLSGTVHSVYRGATNIKWPGQWWTLVTPGGITGPTTVTCNLRGVRQGDSVSTRGGFLKIGPAVINIPTLLWQPNPWPQPVWTGLRERAEYLRAGSSATARHFAAECAKGRRIVGQGLGLMPAGDEVMVGWLATRHALGLPIPSIDTGGTSEIRAHYLLQASNGHFHRPLVEALQAVLTDDAELPDRIDALYATGRASGSDAAAGAAQALIDVMAQDAA